MSPDTSVHISRYINTYAVLVPNGGEWYVLCWYSDTPYIWREVENDMCCVHWYHSVWGGGWE